MTEYITFDGLNGETALARLLSFLDGQQHAACAKALIQTFGSYRSALEAPRSELLQIPGVDDRMADFICAIKAAAVYYLDDQNASLQRIFDTASACELLRPRFLGRKREAVVLLLLDGRGRMLYNGVVNEGSVSEVPIYIRRVVELCLKYDAYTAIIAHNHPSGNPAPSKNDLNATRDLTFSLNGIDVELLDHIIFAGQDHMSLRSSEWLDRLKEEVDAYKKALQRESMEQEQALFHE